LLFALPPLISFSVLAAMVFLSCQSFAGDAPGELPLTDVFVGGQDGYPAFRIPSIVKTQRGALLAFAEGRASKADHSRNKIVVKRSTDDGKTWGKIQLLDDEGADCLNNPTAVVLSGAGRIILMYQRYPAAFHENGVLPGLKGEGICRGFVTRSDDDGVGWTPPEEITASVKRPTEATSIASGPGIGIQLTRGPHAGRVLIPFNQGPGGHWKVYSVYSDDQGQTWKYGAVAPGDPHAGPNEVQFVELSGGRVMLNARDQAGSRHRLIATSSDGGETWSALAEDPALIEPRCQASILRHAQNTNPANDVLLFSNPASTLSRTNGTVRLSEDDGRTWAASRMIYAGSFGYSCLVTLDPLTVGCLFERDDYNKISFSAFTLDWITAKGPPPPK
jgi:sialidase-1